MTLERVVVRVPATVANLGPGFDVLGLALSWYDEIKVERHDGPLEITASGLGAEGVKRDASNGIVVAMRALGIEPHGLRVHKMTAVAFGRGFGSSAISIAGGLTAGRALFGTPHTDDDLLALAIEMEGHADNVAPALRGGVSVSAGSKVVRLVAPDDLSVLVCAAPSPLPTRVARGAVPDTLSRADAVHNIARASQLVAAIATRQYDVLLDATDDRFHQPARFELMPDSGTLVRALRAEGIAAFLSGAGPSVSALVPSSDAARAEAVATARAPDGWNVRVESIDARGATVVDSR